MKRLSIMATFWLLLATIALGEGAAEEAFATPGFAIGNPGPFGQPQPPIAYFPAHSADMGTLRYVSVDLAPGGTLGGHIQAPLGELPLAVTGIVSNDIDGNWVLANNMSAVSGSFGASVQGELQASVGTFMGSAIGAIPTPDIFGGAGVGFRSGPIHAGLDAMFGASSDDYTESISGTADSTYTEDFQSSATLLDAEGTLALDGLANGASATVVARLGIGAASGTISSGAAASIPDEDDTLSVGGSYVGLRARGIVSLSELLTLSLIVGYDSLVHQIAATADGVALTEADSPILNQDLAFTGYGGGVAVKLSQADKAFLAAFASVAAGTFSYKDDPVGNVVKPQDSRARSTYRGGVFGESAIGERLVVRGGASITVTDESRVVDEDPGNATTNQVFGVAPSFGAGFGVHIMDPVYLDFALDTGNLDGTGGIFQSPMARTTITIVL